MLKANKFKTRSYCEINAVNNKNTVVRVCMNAVTDYSPWLMPITSLSQNYDLFDAVILY